MRTDLTKPFSQPSGADSSDALSKLSSEADVLHIGEGHSREAGMTYEQTKVLAKLDQAIVGVVEASEAMVRGRNHVSAKAAAEVAMKLVEVRGAYLGTMVQVRVEPVT